MPPQPWIFMCPSSRGIGLALTRKLLRDTKLPVIATARNDLDGARKRILDGLDVDAGRLEVLKLDVTDESTISAAASHCASRFPPPSNSNSSSPSYLHLSFLLPGILHRPPEKSPLQISSSTTLSTFTTNTLGPMLLAKHFLPFLPPKRFSLAPKDSDSILPSRAVMALMAARVGSTNDNSLGGWYAYRCSKAAIFQFAKGLDIYLKQQHSGDNAAALGLHPGTVRTGLSEGFLGAEGGKEGVLEVEEAAEKLVGVVRDRGGNGEKEGRGRVWDWKGDEIVP